MHTHLPNKPSNPERTRMRGFTLIELMITVAVLGILAAIALPSYQAYVQQSRRADGKAALSRAATWLERASVPTGLYPATLPATLATSESGFYSITYTPSAAPRVSYTLTATRQGVQGTDPCGNFTLTQAGTKGVVGGSKTVRECWDR